MSRKYTRTIAIAKQIVSENVLVPIEQISFGIDPKLKFIKDGGVSVLQLRNDTTMEYDTITTMGSPAALRITTLDQNPGD